jgi:hypothetical protein
LSNHQSYPLDLPPEPDQTWIGSMASRAADSIKDLFISEHKEKFMSFAEDRAENDRCRIKLPELQRKLAAEETQFEQAKKILDFFKGAEFPKSIFKNAQKHPAGINSLAAIAGQFSGEYLLMIFNDKILEEAAKSLAVRKKTLEDFKRENSARLKRLGLI